MNCHFDRPWILELQYSNVSSDEEELTVPDDLAEYTLEGKWEKVIDLYNQLIPSVSHVALDLDEEGVHGSRACEGNYHAQAAKCEE